MKNRRPPKKSETIEVRLTHEAKKALVNRARSEGRSASAIIRECVADYLGSEAKERPSMLSTIWKPALASAALLGGAALLSLSFSTPLSAGPDLTVAFEQLDRNHDHAISLDEFIGRNADMLFVNKALKRSDGGEKKIFVLPVAKQAPVAGAVSPPKELLQQEFAKEDADRDGKVTFAEFTAYHRAVLSEGFAQMDGNHDGYLERTEYEAAQSIAPGGGAVPFDKLDTNGDGRLSMAELFA